MSSYYFKDYKEKEKMRALRKLVVLWLVGVTLLSLAGCGNKSEGDIVTKKNDTHTEADGGEASSESETTEEETNDNLGSADAQSNTVIEAFPVRSSTVVPLFVGYRSDESTLKEIGSVSVPTGWYMGRILFRDTSWTDMSYDTDMFTSGDMYEKLQQTDELSVSSEFPYAALSVFNYPDGSDMEYSERVYINYYALPKDSVEYTWDTDTDSKQNIHEMEGLKYIVIPDAGMVEIHLYCSDGNVIEITVSCESINESNAESFVNAAVQYCDVL